MKIAKILLPLALCFVLLAGCGKKVELAGWEDYKDHPAPGDRRKCRLVCTEKAGPVVQRGRQVQEAFFRRMTAGLDPQDLAAFRRCLEGFQRNLSQMTQEDDQ